jgi:hypothetical protein
MAVHGVVTVLLFLCALAALVGVYKSHFLAVGLTFGTTQGSLSLIAFAVTITVAMKQLIKCYTKCDVCFPPMTGKGK